MKRRNRFLLSILSLFSFLLFIALILMIVFLSLSEFWGWTILILLIFNLISFFTAIGVFFSNRIHEVKASWIFVLFIPIIGVFIFLPFGITPFRLKDSESLNNEKVNVISCEDYSFTKKILKKGKDIDNISIYEFQKSPIYTKNHLCFLSQYDFFVKTIEYIEKAKETINIEFYIIANSCFFKVLINKLAKKAKEGIKIKFMYDYAGSKNRFYKKTIRELKKIGVDVAIFNPPGMTKYISMTNFRSHRKGIFIDNKYAITGGSNIGDEYLNVRKEYFNWRDINFLIEGETVHTLNLNFLNDWYLHSSKRGSKSQKEIKKEFDLLKKQDCKKNAIAIQCINSEPYSEYKFFKNFLLSIFCEAKKSIKIISPYFAINDEIIGILNLKALSSVDVEILIPGLPDNKHFIIDANHRSFKKLNSKVKIYEYDGFIHSKGILIDDEKVILGTNNLDYRSIMINFETAFYIKNKLVIKDFLKEYNLCKTYSNFIDHKRFYSELNLFKKIKMNLMDIIFPLI